MGDFNRSMKSGNQLSRVIYSIMAQVELENRQAPVTKTGRMRYLENLAVASGGTLKKFVKDANEREAEPNRLASHNVEALQNSLKLPEDVTNQSDWTVGDKDWIFVTLAY